jgi:hypothetical protein
MSVKFVLPVETAKMARALDGLAPEDRAFVGETIAFLGADSIETEEVAVSVEAGQLSMRIERMTEADRNVLKGLVSRIMARNKDVRRKK